MISRKGEEGGGEREGGIFKIRMIKDRMRSRVLMSKPGCARGLRRESRGRGCSVIYMSKDSMDEVLASEAEEDIHPS